MYKSNKTFAYEMDNDKAILYCKKINNTTYEAIYDLQEINNDEDTVILFNFERDGYVKCSESDKLVLSESNDFINFVHLLGGKIYSYGFFYRMTCPTTIKQNDEEDYNPRDNIILIKEKEK